MIPQITDEQRAALHEANDIGPIVVVDPSNKTNYVLLREDAFQKYAKSDAADFDPRLAYPFIADVMATDDTGDPLLASYQNVQR